MWKGPPHDPMGGFVGDAGPNSKGGLEGLLGMCH